MFSRDDSYLYFRNEPGYRPLKWFRFGIPSQRTRAHGNGLDIQRGPFAQLAWGRVTIGGYWFNSGSNEQVFVDSINATF